MFDMLAFTLEYRTAVDEIAGNKAANLRQYELTDEEWRIAEQLHDTLKVGHSVCLHIFLPAALFSPNFHPSYVFTSSGKPLKS